MYLGLFICGQFWMFQILGQVVFCLFLDVLLICSLAASKFEDLRGATSESKPRVQESSAQQKKVDKCFPPEVGGYFKTIFQPWQVSTLERFVLSPSKKLLKSKTDRRQQRKQRRKKALEKKRKRQWSLASLATPRKLENTKRVARFWLVRCFFLGGWLHEN